MYTFATSLMIGFFFFINIDEEGKIDKGNERQKWREENRDFPKVSAKS